MRRPALSALARRRGAQVVDAITGGARARLQDEIRRDLENADRTPGDDRNKERLAALLDEATNTTAAYAPFRGSPLADYPVIDKSFVRENTDKLLSTAFARQELSVASTSGSTGAPLYVYQDPAKRRHRAAEALYFSTLAGYQTGMPLFYVKVWSDRNKKSRLATRLQNLHPVDVTHFDQAEQDLLLQRIAASRQPVTIVAYASALELLARNLATSDSPTVTNVVTIVSQSEALPANARDVLEKRLNAPVVERYGNEEVGILAQQSLHHDGLLQVNTHSVHMEVLSLRADEPAAPGALGRIVITDLVNRGMPLIRYDTGDLGRFAVSADGTLDARFLAELRGRKLDQIYDTADRAVSPHLLANFFWKYPELVQAQVEQVDRGRYILRVNGPESLRTDLLTRDLRSILGTSAAVEVLHVDAIPVLRSGKRQTVISKYRPA